MWSLDAGAMELPERVSLSVGGNTSIQHLVLQVSIIFIIIIIIMIIVTRFTTSAESTSPPQVTPAGCWWSTRRSPLSTAPASSPSTSTARSPAMTMMVMTMFSGTPPVDCWARPLSSPGPTWDTHIGWAGGCLGEQKYVVFTLKISTRQSIFGSVCLFVCL